jgi:hypothetical protein
MFIPGVELGSSGCVVKPGVTLADWLSEPVNTRLFAQELFPALLAKAPVQERSPLSLIGIEKGCEGWQGTRSRTRRAEQEGCFAGDAVQPGS